MSSSSTSGRMLCVFGPGGEFVQEVRAASAPGGFQRKALSAAEHESLRQCLVRELGIANVLSAGSRNAPRAAIVSPEQTAVVPPVLLESLRTFLSEESAHASQKA